MGSNPSGLFSSTPHERRDCPVGDRRGLILCRCNPHPRRSLLMGRSTTRMRGLRFWVRLWGRPCGGTASLRDESLSLNRPAYLHLITWLALLPPTFFPGPLPLPP